MGNKWSRQKWVFILLSNVMQIQLFLALNKYEIATTPSLRYKISLAMFLEDSNRLWIHIPSTCSIISVSFLSGHMRLSNISVKIKTPDVEQILAPYNFCFPYFCWYSLEADINRFLTMYVIYRCKNILVPEKMVSSHFFCT